LPQIFNIIRAGNANGLSLSMLVIESACQLVNTLYYQSGDRRGTAFSVYGENVVIGACNVAIFALIAHYRRKKMWLAAAVLMTGVVGHRLKADPKLLHVMQGASIAFYILSRLPQVQLNYATKSTGVLSVATFAGNLCGSLVRVNTALNERDGMLMSSAVVSVALNGLLVWQILRYGGASRAR
jgi:uncharacterized protein with PQ loop repeat